MSCLWDEAIKRTKSMVAFVFTKTLTPAGALAAGGIGITVFVATGFHGVLVLMLFFLLSVFATVHKKEIKRELNKETHQSGGRTAGQVFANGGVAALLSMLALVDPIHAEVYLLMMAASLASALADTLSSELGMVYGSRYFNVLTLKRDANGLDGVVSIEGLLIGAIGAMVVGLAYAGFTSTAVIVAFAGIMGNLMDSVLGASLERKGFLVNNVVNFLNTLFAALVALLLA